MNKRFIKYRKGRIYLIKGSFAFFIILISISCSTLKIEKPAEKYDPAVYNPQFSYVNIPLEINAFQLKKLVNKKLSGTIYSDTSFEDNDKDDLMMFANKRDSIDITFTGNYISYTVPLNIWLRKRFTVGILGMNMSNIAEAEAAIILRFKTRVNLNPDWSISSATISDGYQWLNTPKLTVGNLELPVPMISDMLVNSSLRYITKGIDNSIRTAVDLRRIVNDTWSLMQKPLLISPENSIWLRLTPAEISTVPLHGNTGILNYSIGLKTMVELFYGEQPKSVNSGPLPSLKTTSSLPETFNVNLSLDIPFKEINNIARQQLKGYTMSYKSFKVKVTDVSLYGQGKFMIVAVPVEGSVKGTIYLAGIPVFNKDSLTIELENLDYSVSTHNVVIKTASWLFHSGFVKTLKSKLVFPLGDQLYSARKQLAGYIRDNRSVENFTINGLVESLDPDKILITPESVKAYFRLSGKIRVSLLP